MNPAERFITSQEKQRALDAAARAKKVRDNKRVMLFVPQKLLREFMAEAIKRNLLAADAFALAVEAMKKGKV